MILLDEKVAVNLIMILLYIILILHLINVLIYCFYALKKRRTPLHLFLKERCTDIFTHSYLESPRKSDQAL